MPAPIDLTGKKIGRWSVGRLVPGVRRRYECTCECGTIRLVDSSNLLLGASLSCGCGARQNRRTHGRHGTPEYRAWKAMKNRCYNSNLESWHRYGGRGIKVYGPWLTDFEAFFEHIGPRPSPKHSVDRIDNDGDYAPGNVRWATNKEQAASRCLTKLSDDDVAFIRHWISRGHRSKHIAEAFSITDSYVRMIARGDSR